MFFIHYLSFIFIINISVCLATTVLFIWEYLKTKNIRLISILLFLFTITTTALIQYLNFNFHHQLLLFGDTSHILSCLNIITSGSIFFTVPFMAHTIFPNSFSKKLSLIFLCLFFAFISVNFFGLVPPTPGLTIGVMIVFFSLGCYAFFYSLFSISRIPIKELKKSKDWLYILVLAIIGMFSFPFFIPADFTMIPLGILDVRFSFIPVHTILMNCGILGVTFSKRKWRDRKKQGPYPVQAEEDASDKVIVDFPTPEINQYGLSPREKEVAGFLLRGYSYKAIAETLFISQTTVKTHIYRIYQKANVNNKGEFIVQASMRRIISEHTK